MFSYIDSVEHDYCSLNVAFDEFAVAVVDVLVADDIVVAEDVVVVVVFAAELDEYVIAEAFVEDMIFDVAEDMLSEEFGVDMMFEIFAEGDAEDDVEAADDVADELFVVGVVVVDVDEFVDVVDVLFADVDVVDDMIVFENIVIFVLFDNVFDEYVNFEVV